MHTEGTYTEFTLPLMAEIFRQLRPGTAVECTPSLPEYLSTSLASSGKRESACMHGNPRESAAYGTPARRSAQSIIWRIRQSTRSFRYPREKARRAECAPRLHIDRITGEHHAQHHYRQSRSDHWR